jgi:uncharacterized protein (TIGR02996 family)
MTPDDAFLADIIANPDDNSLRLIYADYLDEQGDPRGEFLRIATELEAVEGVEPPTDIRGRLARARWIGRLHRRWRELVPLVDRAWVALLHRGELQCGYVPDDDGQCPGRWDRLPSEPGKSFARYCRTCRRWVRLCWSAQEVERAVREDRVVASVRVLSSSRRPSRGGSNEAGGSR